jgi:hypothetical protein
MPLFSSVVLGAGRRRWKHLQPLEAVYILSLNRKICSFELNDKRDAPDVLHLKGIRSNPLLICLAPRAQSEG